MTNPQNPPLDELLPGMRFAFFELMWPGFEWIKSLWIGESNGRYHLFVQTTGPQDKKKWRRFNYLAGRVFKGGERMLDELTAGSKHKIEFTIQYGPTVPHNDGYQELMSTRVFKKIAKKHAPWRLDYGR
jgi:hypothetical protein